MTQASAKRHRHRLSSRILCAVLILGAGVLPPGALAQRQRMDVQEEPQEQSPEPIPVTGDSLEEFRDRLVRYLNGVEATLTQALDHPLIGDELRARIAGASFQLPIPAEIYDAIDTLNDEELEQLRSAFSSAPAMFEAPLALSAALAELDRQQLAQRIEDESAPPGSPALATMCGTNYSEFDKILAKKQVVRALVRAQGGLKLGAKISEKIADVLRAVLEDIPVIGSKLVIVFHVIWGVTHASQAALGIASSVLDLQIAESELCLASCLSDSADAAHPNLDSGVWRGKGCDNRDNNCDSQGLIDEGAEDRFRPEVFVDSSAALRCYASQGEAGAAAMRAVTARDDCRLSGPPSVGVVSQSCAAQVTAQASDMGSPQNMSQPVVFSLKVDGDSPVITSPSLNACYPTVADARNALGAAAVSDACSSFSTMIGATEKECVANLELAAIDECGNRSVLAQSVRVDGSSPEVMIETLKLPSIDGLSCFSSETEAVAAVEAATRVSDNCTAASDLTFAMSTSGTACNLNVTATAADACSGVTTQPSSDSLQVRVDTAPPALSCSVAQRVLWPADGNLVDIGFALNLADNCDPQPTLEVTVTSDEAARYAYVTQNGTDPYPDAVVERTPTGGIARILLRAQRRSTSVSSFDGRVYRIRVVATDACGLSSRTECWVEVPSTSGSTAVNSGQNYDATAEN